MKTLLKNAKILTLKDKNIIDGEILVEGNKIAQIAQKIKVKVDHTIDCEGNLLMPGLKNAHAHSAMVFLRSHADDLPVQKWLTNYVFPLEENFQKGDIYHLTKLACLEYLTSGITANFDMYYHVDEIKKANEDIGMRSLILLMPNFDGSNVGSLTPSEAKERYLSWNKKDGLIKGAIGFHAAYTSSKNQLKGIAKLSHALKAPIYTHCSESMSEVKDSFKRYKMSPLAYLTKFNLFDYGGGVYHAVHFDKNDIKLAKKHNLFICTCPASNLKLASGIAPLKDFFKNGIKVAIGTDGPASNNGLDMFREMYLASTLSKYHENDASSMDAFEILKMATVNSAHMLGLKNADVLAKGKLADIIMIDLHKPDMQPINNITKNIVYSGNKLDVKMTMIDGKILYYNHKFFLKEDVKNIYKKANEITKRLIKVGEKKLKK